LQRQGIVAQVCDLRQQALAVSQLRSLTILLFDGRSHGSFQVPGAMPANCILGEVIAPGHRAQSFTREQVTIYCGAPAWTGVADRARWHATHIAPERDQH
jgi:hypothetical protein